MTVPYFFLAGVFLVAPLQVEHEHLQPFTGAPFLHLQPQDAHIIIYLS
jgi:hypothetical protein